MRFRYLSAWVVFIAPLVAQQPGTQRSTPAPALTIYNQEFAVVRDQIRLDLKAGTSHVQFSGVTAYLEPDSVMLRNCSGKRVPRILEQNFRAPISLQQMLAMYEGQTVDFLLYRGDQREIVQGKIVRAGNQCRPGQPCLPQTAIGTTSYGQYAGYDTPVSYFEEPLIEVNGKLQFSLPGTPLFPPPSNQSDLHPVLDWVLESDNAGPTSCELSYVSGGMTWNADYNAIAPQNGDRLDLIGWVTLENRSGKAFENATIKLMAGDVNKLKPRTADTFVFTAGAGIGGGVGGGPPVTERTFEEYHLYTLQRPTTLRDHETKQVEFLHRAGVPAKRIYVYDGYTFTPQPGMVYNPDYLRQQRSLGTTSNPKVWVMQEITNTEQTGLGMPLPRGRMRFYRQDTDGQLEFVGENTIDHTPRGEVLRIYTGNAFDLTGEHKRTNYKVDNAQEWADESFEVTVKNHKKEPVEVNIVEHLYRGATWEITSKSLPFRKRDSRTIEFPVQVPADGQQTVIYTVHYTW